MTWTNEKPTVAGWYWYRDEYGARVILTIQGPRGLIANDSGSSGHFLSLDYFPAQFAGPIPKPEEAPK